MAEYPAYHENGKSNRNPKTHCAQVTPIPGGKMQHFNLRYRFTSVRRNLMEQTHIPAGSGGLSSNRSADIHRLSNRREIQRRQIL